MVSLVSSLPCFYEADLIEPKSTPNFCETQMTTEAAEGRVCQFERKISLLIGPFGLIVVGEMITGPLHSLARSSYRLQDQTAILNLSIDTNSFAFDHILRCKLRAFPAVPNRFGITCRYWRDRTLKKRAGLAPNSIAPSTRPSRSRLGKI
ncbi:hypothetical protein [Bradyrhizobium centrosematis]|uniref:hypothetical protein n=1 Tax=Bradyrhizobium centrosematis TaxID=1300039 RepID=UPI00388DD559